MTGGFLITSSKIFPFRPNPVHRLSTKVKLSKPEGMKIEFFWFG
jgi:hypothetical protein